MDYRVNNTYMKSETLCLTKEIDKLLFDYLKAPVETPEKLNQRRLLEDLITNYLSIVPHEEKFHFREMAQVLHKSVEEIEDFHGYLTTAAWSALVAYAENLLVRPWRKEFKEIKTYSGFYKHHIETCLIGGEIILNLMGYKPNGSGSMTLVEPVDKKRVLKVIKDTFIALVECKIMKTIMENTVNSGRRDCTWLDVLKCRERNVCSSEEAIKSLIQEYYYPETMYKYPLSMGCYSGYRYNHHPIPPPMYVHGVAYDPYLQQPVHYPVCHLNGYYQTLPSNYESPSASKPSNYAVQTGKLIEVDSTPCNTVGYKRSEGKEARQHSQYNNYSSRKPSVNKSSDSIYSSRSDDMAELESNFINFMGFETDKNLSEPSCSKIEVSTSTRKKTKDFSVTDSASASITTKEISKRPKDINAHSNPKEIWSCSHCTFDNHISHDVCSMCGKSRIQGNESFPLESGGSECPFCTLVNEKGLTRCKACNSGLENSPTYI